MDSVVLSAGRRHVFVRGVHGGPPPGAGQQQPSGSENGNAATWLRSHVAPGHLGLISHLATDDVADDLADDVAVGGRHLISSHGISPLPA